MFITELQQVQPHTL